MPTVLETHGADPAPWPPGGPAAVPWQTVRAHRLTDGLEPKRTKRLVLIRLFLGLALAAALLLGHLHATGSLSFALHGLPAITLPR
jgi:hypothetical protein